MSRLWCVIHPSAGLDYEEQYRLWEAVDIWSDGERGLTFQDSFEHMLTTQRKSECLGPMRVEAGDHWTEEKIVASIMKEFCLVTRYCDRIVIGSDTTGVEASYSHEKLWPSAKTNLTEH